MYQKVQVLAELASFDQLPDSASVRLPPIADKKLAHK